MLYVSPAYESMWGRSCQSLLDDPQSYMEGIHPLDKERMIRENAAMYQTGYIDAECRVVRPDGSVRWVWIKGNPITQQGQIVRLVGVIKDITDRRRLAAERDALLARLQLQIQRMPLIYILFDADFRITDWNPAAERTFGYTREEALGKQPNDLNPPSFHAGATKIMDRIRAGDMAAHSVNENLTKDGRTITCEWFNTPLMTEDGRFDGLPLPRQGCHRATVFGGAVSAGAEDGGGRPTGGRRGPRLQQPADHHLRLQRDPARHAGVERPDAGVRQGHQRGRASEPPRSPASCSRSAARRCWSRRCWT